MSLYTQFYVLARVAGDSLVRRRLYFMAAIPNLIARCNIDTVVFTLRSCNVAEAYQTVEHTALPLPDKIL